MSTFHEDGRVRADASKDFFLYMLIRDITLEDAVVDLVDNSVDAAHSRFNKLKDALVVLDLSRKGFKIADNCGGFSLERAKDYVFRFGREKDTRPADDDGRETIGQFGVGLKRAIFKLGEVATITSRHEVDSFAVHINVPEWRNDPRLEWGFPYEVLPVTKERGTTVEINALHDLVKAQLDSVYLDDLGTKIRRAHHFALREGLKLRYNGTYLEPFQIDLISTPELRPIEKRVSVDQDVDLQIIAGVGESEPTDAGWYVFCNERMVLSADQSATTGWGESSIERSSPKYHNQFARFRGIARFTARDARNLPWNTTKRGVDSTHPAFQRGRAQMVDSLKSVVRFLNLLDRELDSDEQPLRRAVEHAESLGLKPFETVKTSPVLVHPKFVSRRTTASICYRAPLDQVEDLKEETGKHRNEDLAKFCFDYTYKHFVGED